MLPANTPVVHGTYRRLTPLAPGAYGWSSWKPRFCGSQLPILPLWSRPQPFSCTPHRLSWPLRLAKLTFGGSPVPQVLGNDGCLVSPIKVKLHDRKRQIDNFHLFHCETCYSCIFGSMTGSHVSGTVLFDILSPHSQELNEMRASSFLILRCLLLRHG